MGVQEDCKQLGFAELHLCRLYVYFPLHNCHLIEQFFSYFLIPEIPVIESIHCHLGEEQLILVFKLEEKIIECL